MALREEGVPAAASHTTNAIMDMGMDMRHGSCACNTYARTCHRRRPRMIMRSHQYKAVRRVVGRRRLVACASASASTVSP
eukprot:2970141-Prymnesium_polylepis.1